MKKELVMNELITEWEPECACGFKFTAPILEDDPNGNYAHEILMTHMMECDYEVPAQEN